jgi:hypothetical protein
MKYVISVALLLTILLAGCGGGGQEGSTTRPTGTVSVAVTWPEPSGQVQTRAIPALSQSIRVSVLEGTQEVGSTILVRPQAPPWNSRGTIANVPASPQATLKASAYPTATASGVALAEGSIEIVVPRAAIAYPLGGNPGEAIVLTLASTITQVAISPSPGVVQVGKYLQLTATPKNATGAIVLVAPSAFSWSVASGLANATVDSSSGVVTGIAAGDAIIKATETESGVSGTVPLTVWGSDGQAEIIITGVRGARR